MKIIDNKKDYYDYASGVNGIDPLAIYDRRDGTVIDTDSYGLVGNLDYWFSKRFGETHSFNWKKDQIYTGYFILEAGYMWYAFKVTRKYDEEGGDITLEPELLYKKRVETKVGDTPLVLIPAQHHHFDYRIWKRLEKPELRPERDKNKYVNNPILMKTFIPGFVPAEEIWNELCSYLLAIREKPFVDKRNDVEKAESHGFDRKTSFRGKNK